MVRPICGANVSASLRIWQGDLDRPGVRQLPFRQVCCRAVRDAGPQVSHAGTQGSLRGPDGDSGRSCVNEQFDLIIRASRVITGGAETACGIGITAGRIAAVWPLDERAGPPAGRPPDADGPAGVFEIGADVAVLPGLVDSHVHVCEPGNTEWEGFATATSAAAAGGITTLVDMPLDSVPATVDAAALEIKRHAARGQCRVDVGFWGGVIPGNLGQLAPLHAAGVLGFKCFLSDSGAEDFPPVDTRQLTAALRVLRGLDSPLLVHAESAEAGAAAGAAAAIGGSPGRSYAGYLASRRREKQKTSHVPPTQTPPPPAG